jgi:hypothetical protein
VHAAYPSAQLMQGYPPPDVSGPFRYVLGDTLNTPAPQPAAGVRKRARTQTQTGTTARKRACKDATAANSGAVPAIPGVGPTNAPPAADPPSTPISQQPSSDFVSLLDHAKKNTAEASDIWYFLRGLSSAARPQTLPERETLSEKRPDPKVYTHLACHLCP